MRNLTVFSFVFLVSLVLSSCTTFQRNFTTEKIMKVHQGMGSDEILELFGDPKDISVGVCGRAPDQWTCTTWEYEEFSYDDRASFTFSGEHDSLKLNDFDVDRD